MGVDWNERVIKVHEGGWNYVAHNVGIAPGNKLCTEACRIEGISYHLSFVELPVFGVLWQFVCSSLR